MNERRFQQLFDDYHTGDLSDIDMPDFINALLEREADAYSKGRRAGQRGVGIITIISLCLWVLMVYVIFCK